MQTFMPYADFSESAQALDNKRLGKQRVEAYQILKVLTGAGTGWAHHPAVLMWRGYTAALMAYGRAVCIEWRKRGFKDSLLDKFTVGENAAPVPLWVHDTAFHASHRSNLLRKDFAYYSQHGWSESNDLPYIWPSEPEN